jgi:hypothetical protein
MPPIEERLNDLLNETRLAMLGAQLLLGLQYRAAFSPGFARLPATFQALGCVALLFILVAAILLLTTPAYHQIAERSHATSHMLDRASRVLQIALLPLSLALAIDISLALVSHFGALRAGLAAGVFLFGAWSAWYVVPLFSATRSSRKEQKMEDKQQSVEARIAQALTELRVVLPGAQALFGFQVSAVLTESFEHLSDAAKAVHLASLMLIVAAIIMLIAPAAYHRIATGGDANASMLRYTVRMMIPAEGLIALGLVGDAYVTTGMISRSPLLALALSAAALVGCLMLLYVVPLMARRQANETETIDRRRRVTPLGR